MKQHSTNNKFKLNAIATVAGEMIAGHGEDSYSYYCNDQKGFVGIFDGCGGTGGKSYNAYGGYTGAYIASRVMAATTIEWWKASTFSTLSEKELKETVFKRLKLLKENDNASGETNMLKGSLSKKSFPTTAVIVGFDFSSNPVCRFLWAGDSRGYVLDKQGLSQVTKDDVDGDVDAFSNLESDARVTNVVNADQDFFFHKKDIHLKDPSIVFAATDGCFSYYETPMEFEHLMLSTLFETNSIFAWEKKLNTLLKKQASDDYTLGIIVCGFKRFKDIKAYFASRYETLQSEYMDKLADMRAGGKGDVNDLWQKYKGTYYRYEQ